MSERKNDGHHWVGAATVDLPSTIVRGAFKRGTIRLRREQKVSIEEVYCSACRQTYERGSGQKCPAVDKDTRKHLMGGPIDQRRRRDPADLGAEPQAALG
jgi:hypothetical protein